MLAEFDRARTKFVEGRKAEQQEADRICGRMYLDIGKILQNEGKGEIHPTKGFFLEVLEALRRTNLYLQDSSKETMSPAEETNYWTLSRDVDFDEEIHEVTIKAYGDKNPNKATRSFMWIDGSSHSIELTKNHGVMWEEKQVGKRSRPIRGQRASIVEAQFYEAVLNRFQAQVAKPE